MFKSDNSTSDENYISDSGKENRNKEIIAQVPVRGRGHGHGHGGVEKPELVWSQVMVKPIIHNWQGDLEIIGPYK